MDIKVNGGNASVIHCRNLADGHRIGGRGGNGVYDNFSMLQ